MKLVKCKVCNGTGKVDCCNGHMCPGWTECFDCGGKGKHLSEEDKKLKEKLLELMDYK